VPDPKISGANVWTVILIFAIPIALALLSVLLWSCIPVEKGPFFFLHTLSPFVITVLALFVFTLAPILLSLLLPPLGAPLLGWVLYGVWIISGILIFFYPYYRWAYVRGLKKPFGRKGKNIQKQSAAVATLLSFILLFSLAIVTVLVFQFVGTPTISFLLRAVVFFLYVSLLLAIFKYFASQLAIFLFRLGRTRKKQ